MNRVIANVVWTRCGVKDFMYEVNSYLDSGWDLVSISIEKNLLRIVCLAVLAKDADDIGDAEDCVTPE
mgnify:CR=1 FL=1